MAWHWYWDYTYHCWSCYWDESESGDTSNCQSQSGGGSGEEGEQASSSHNQGPPQPSHPIDSGENEFRWTTPYEKDEAEAHYRLRTLKATPIEHDMLIAALEGNDERLSSSDHALVAKVCKHWGGVGTLNDAKQVLSKLATSKDLKTGVAIKPGTLEFAVCKAVLAAGRAGDRELRNSLRNSHPCYCLPPFFLGGCIHGRPSLIAPRKGPRDSTCKECSKCTRCGRPLISTQCIGIIVYIGA